MNAFGNKPQSPTLYETEAACRYDSRDDTRPTDVSPALNDLLDLIAEQLVECDLKNGEGVDDGIACAKI